MKSLFLATCCAATVLGCAAEPINALDPEPTTANASATGTSLGGGEHQAPPSGWNAGWEALGGGALGEPVITATTDLRTDVFVVGTNHAIYHRWDEGAGAGWQPVGTWENLGNMGRDVENVAAVAHPRQRLVEIFVREIATKNLLTRSIYTNGQSSPWQNLGGGFVGTPTAAAVNVSSDGGILGPITTFGTHVVVRAPDNTIWARWGVAAMWQGWYQLPGATNADPKIFAVNDHVELVVRGTDDNVYREWRDPGTNWQPNWQPLGGDGQVAGVPSVSATSATDVFVVADWKDKGIRVNRLSGSSWSGFQGIPNATPWSDDIHGASRPVVVSPFAGDAAVYVQGTDKALWGMESSNGWHGTQLAPCFKTSGAPSIAVRNGDDQVLVVTDKGGAVWVTRYGFYPSTSGAQPPTCACGGDNSECCYGNSCSSGTCQNEGDALMCRCGGENQACCGVNGCDNDGLSCDRGSHTCQQCGDVNELACAGNVCRGQDVHAYLDGNQMRCLHCGWNGENTCPGNTCAPGLIVAPDAQGNTKCQLCGGVNQIACPPANSCSWNGLVAAPDGHGRMTCQECGEWGSRLCCAHDSCPSGQVCQKGVGPVPSIGQCNVAPPPPPVCHLQNSDYTACCNHQCMGHRFCNSSNQCQPNFGGNPQNPPPDACPVHVIAHVTTCTNHTDGTPSNLSHSFCAEGCGSTRDAAEQAAKTGVAQQGCVGDGPGCCQVTVDTNFNTCGE